MFHPHAELRFSRPGVGYGVFATELIPMGTVVYIEDPLEIVIKPDSKLHQDPKYAEIILKYGYETPDGSYVISWDLAKYVNHCCHYNILATAYGFDIAVRDIQPGEEITDDYAAYSFNEYMELLCPYPDCRKVLQPGDFDHYIEQWDTDLQTALADILRVKQPLFKYMTHEIYEELMAYKDGKQAYRSIRTTKYPPAH